MTIDEAVPVGGSGRLVSEESEGVEFPVLPLGSYPMRVLELEDLGWHEFTDKDKGKVTRRRKALVVFQSAETFQMEDGTIQPHLVHYFINNIGLGNADFPTDWRKTVSAYLKAQRGKGYEAGEKVDLYEIFMDGGKGRMMRVLIGKYRETGGRRYPVVTSLEPTREGDPEIEPWGDYVAYSERRQATEAAKGGDGKPEDENQSAGAPGHDGSQEAAADDEDCPF
jgi:hypothetical protein